MRLISMQTSSVIAGVAIASLAIGRPARAQSLAQRVVQIDGVVEVSYPSRPQVCGDGRGMIGHLFGRSMSVSANAMSSNRGRWSDWPCEHGPARVVVSVASGEVTRLRAYVGAPRAPRADVRTISATASDAAAWLTALITNGSGRVPADAMVPLMIADGPEPWPLLLRVARDETRSRATRGTALVWLANGITEKLGLADDDDARRSDDDEMREQAVFVLSQRPKAESVPDLIDLAKHGKYLAVRRSAIFWLGQSGDPRAADTYAELLAGR